MEALTVDGDDGLNARRPASLGHNDVINGDAASLVDRAETSRRNKQFLSLPM